MDFVYFTREPFSWGEKELVSGMIKRGYTAKVLDWEKMKFSTEGITYEGEKFEIPKAIMLSSRVRTRQLKGEKLFLFDWLDILEENGVQFVNTPSAIRRASNKVRAAYTLNSENVRVAPTVLVNTVEEIEEYLYNWKDIIVKPIDRNGSSGMERLLYDQNRYGDELTSVLSMSQEFDIWTLINTYKTLCLQKYISNPGRDIRVNVVKDKVVSVCAKYAHENTWRTKDINKGMKLEYVELTPEINEVSIAAVKALGLDYAPVDIVEGEDGPTIIEVNTSLSIWPEHETMGITIDPEGSVKYYLDLIEEKIESFLANE